MWRKIADWYSKWEDEQIAVLEQPELVAQAPAYRRFGYQQLAKRSPIERQQLRAAFLAFRGWRGFLATMVMIGTFSLAGLLLRAQFPAMGLGAAIVTGNALGFALSLGLFGAWFNYRKLVHRKFRILVMVLLYTLLAAVGTSGGVFWISDQAPAAVMEKLPRMLALILGVGLAVAVPMLTIGILRNRQHEMLTGQLQRDAERDRMARELAESQLRLLRAQIEPHFLFNTLGAVQQLAEHGAPRAAGLTADLIAFLRASLTDMRREEVALSVEFGLVDSYLRVMQVRLGTRLRFSLDLPAPLAQVTVPSMILLTLVENAIKHGIEPALRGGEITVSAHQCDGGIRLRVQDSGVGMSAAPGEGLGLENVRHRLQLAYGPAASLALHDAAPGLVADITIPHPLSRQ